MFLTGFLLAQNAPVGDEYIQIKPEFVSLFDINMCILFLTPLINKMSVFFV